MDVVIVATANRHKLAEIKTVLGESLAYGSLAEYQDAPALVEDADTFSGNARRKAQQLADWLDRDRPSTTADRRVFVLADDSGLEVDALDGRPGVYSARFASLDTGVPGNASDRDNNQKLLGLMADVPQQKRTARFRCVLALVTVGATRSEESPPVTFEGTCEGKIAVEEQGTGGFGYDPLFVPDGFDKSFAELGAEIKNRLSHRSKALMKLNEFLERI